MMCFTPVVPTVMLSVAILKEWCDGLDYKTVTALQCRCTILPHLRWWSVQCWTIRNSIAVLHLFCSSWLVSSCDVRVSRTNFDNVVICNPRRNGRGRGWHITSWRITKRPTPNTLSFVTCYI